MAGFKITDRPNIFQPGKTLILAGQIMNTIIYIFFAYGISHYAGDRPLQCIDVQVFVSKLAKNSFTHSRVPFCGFCPFSCLLYSFLFPVILGNFGCDVTCQACRENSPRTPCAIALGSKPPLVTRIARTGLGMRLGYTLSIMVWQCQKSPRFVPYLHIGKT